MNYKDISYFIGDAVYIARGNHKAGTHQVLLTYTKAFSDLEETYKKVNSAPVEHLLKDNEFRYVYTKSLMRAEAKRQTKEVYSGEYINVKF